MNSYVTSVFRYHMFIQLFAQLITLPVKFPLYVINIVYNYLFGKFSSSNFLKFIEIEGTRQIIYSHIFEYIAKEFPQFEAMKSNVFYGHQLQNVRYNFPIHTFVNGVLAPF